MYAIRSYYAPLFANARLLARAVEQACEAEGVFVAINNRVSQSVPHLHIHVVPRRRKDGLRGFFWPRHKYQSPEAAQKARQAIRDAVARLRGAEDDHVITSYSIHYTKLYDSRRGASRGRKTAR